MLSTALTAGPVTLTATATSGLAVSFTSTTTGVCTVSGNSVTLVSAGTCSINASQAGNANYQAAPTVTRSFAVDPGRTDDQLHAAVRHGADGWSGDADGDGDLGPCGELHLDDDGRVHGERQFGNAGLGRHLLDQRQPGRQRQLPSRADGGAGASLSTQGGQTISFTQPADTALTAGPVTLTATATSGLAVSFTSTTTGVCTVSGNSVTLVSAGTCSINASQAGNANYQAAPTVARSFAVTQGGQTISFTQPADTALTAGPVTLTATATSGLAVSFTSTTTGVCTVSGNSVTLVSAGTCSINASQAGNANYQAAPTVTKSFAVTLGANIITFNSLTNRAIGSGSFTPSASASSGLTVSFVSTTTSVCSVSGSTVSLLAVGQCTIEARQAGNANYAAASPVDQTFSVTQAITSISLQAPATSLSGYPVTLTATVSGVGPTGTVTFSDGGKTLATVALSGGVATFTTSALSAGKHDLSAAYSGDTRNQPVTSIVVSMTVNSRPDPSQDPDVIGLINAQASAMERFGQTQMDNIQDHLTELHSDDDSGPISLGMSVNTAQSEERGCPAVVWRR